jgi:hypothetical protein
VKLRLPRSLFGRTVLVLAACLLLSQSASLLVNFFDRGSSMYRLNSEQMAQRIARSASLLNRLPKRSARPWRRNSVAGISESSSPCVRSRSKGLHRTRRV